MMNDNDNIRDDLTKILEEFNPNNIETLRRLAVAQNELLPVRLAVFMSFLIPLSYLLAFHEDWRTGDIANMIMALASVISIAITIIGYRSIQRLEKCIGFWKAAMIGDGDRRLLGVKWFLVPVSRDEKPNQ